MAERVDPWHFARRDLAETHLQCFKLGLNSGKGFFARRRMGNSEFLKFSLLPAAAGAGSRAAYTNLWKDTEHPGQALATAIMAGVQPHRPDKVLVGVVNDESDYAKVWNDLSRGVRTVLLVAAAGAQELSSAPERKS